MQRHHGVVGQERALKGIFSRAGERASKNPTLPTVAGSPVKGSCLVESEVTTANECEDDHGVLEQASLHGTSDITDDTSNATRQDTKAEPPGTSPSSSMDKGKQRAEISSSLALNPASAALHALSKSLSSLPQTPPATKPRLVGTRLGLRSTSMATNKGSPAENDPGSALSNASGADLNRSVDTGPGSGSADRTVVNGSGGGKKSSLKVLKKCAIFVDVRTDQGDDAGSLFVDMLRGLGAKVWSMADRYCYGETGELINPPRSWAELFKAVRISCLRTDCQIHWRGTGKGLTIITSVFKCYILQTTAFLMIQSHLLLVLHGLLSVSNNGREWTRRSTKSTLSSSTWRVEIRSLA